MLRSMMRHARLAMIVAGALSALSVSTARAQSAGPRLDAATIAPRASQASAPVQLASLDANARTDAMAYRQGMSQGTVLMIVGGATLLTGAIVGGDAGTIIMIGGGAIGIYGLYEYLQGH